MNQGDRLAFSNGIVILSGLGALLLVVFGGDTHALIPLYMIGVFVSFTLSQAGMVVHWRTLREPGWRTSAAINGFGALVTGVVLAGGRHDEGRGRCVDHHPDDPDAGDHLQHHPSPLRSRRIGADVARLAPGPDRPPCRDRANRRASSAPSSRRFDTPEQCLTTSARCTSRSIRPPRRR